MRRIVLAALALAVAGCSEIAGKDEQALPGITGRWTATVANATFDLPETVIG